MIRLTYLLRRKSGMSLNDFQTHWRTVHGPLVAGHAQHLHCLRHVQVHTVEDEQRETMSRARGQMEPPYDGVVEMWWENVETLERALATDGGQQAAAELLEAERDFVDLPASPLWLNYEYPQVNPTPENLVARERNSIVKTYFPLRALPTLSDDEAQLYWRTQHGPLIRRQAWGRMLRYVQVHRFPHLSKRRCASLGDRGGAISRPRGRLARSRRSGNQHPGGRGGERASDRGREQVHRLLAVLDVVRQRARVR